MLCDVGAGWYLQGGSSLSTVPLTSALKGFSETARAQLQISSSMTVSTWLWDPEANVTCGYRALPPTQASKAGIESVITKMLPNLRFVSYDLPFNAYYINLDRAKDRRKQMEDIFGHLWGDRFRRVSGVDGKNQSHVFELTGDGDYGHELWKCRVENRAYDYISSTYTLSTLGIALAHLKAIKIAYLAGDEVALIMEDDIGPYFMPYWSLGIQDIVDLADTTVWDTIQLSYFPRKSGLTITRHGLIGGHLLKREFQYGTGAYLISRRGMEKVMDTFFTNRSPDALVVIPLGNALEIDNPPYFPTLMTDNYLTLPAMFAVHATGSTSGQENDVIHQDGNKLHWGYWQESHRERLGIYD